MDNKIGSFLNLSDATILFDKNTVRLLKVFLLGPVANPTGNNIYNVNISSIFPGFPSNDFIHLPSNDTYRWIYYDKLLYSRNVNSTRLNFENFKLYDNERIFLVANIRCLEKKKVFWTISKLAGKIWINNQIKYISNNFDEYEFIDCLKIGDNVVLIEMIQINNFNLLIRDFNCFIQEDLEGQILLDYYEQKVKNNIEIVNLKDREDNSKSCVMICPRDLLNLRHETEVHINILNQNRDIVSSEVRSFYEPIIVDSFRDKDESLRNLHYYFLHVQYKSIDGKVNETESVFLNISLEELIKVTQKEYLILQNNFEVNHEYECIFLGVINDLCKMKNLREISDSLVIEMYELFYTALDSCRKASSFIDYLIKQKTTIYYYESTIDNHLEKAYISLPRNYSKSIEYPLILILATNDHENFSKFKNMILKSTENLNVLVGYVTGKGVTTGSYIGEISTLEGLEIIRNSFKIDMNKIYLTGSSNGAYAVWSIAQNFPYMLAAIAPVSGVPYKQNLLNISHLPIINLSGENDVYYESGYKTPSEVFSKYKNHTGVCFQESNHSELAIFRYSKILFIWLLKNKRNIFPKKVHFRTERMRHSKTCWLDILKFSDDKCFVEVELEIMKNNILSIKLMNVEEVMLTLPQEYNQDLKMIQVNNQNIELKNSKNLFLYLVKDGQGYVFQMQNESKNINRNRGLGILGIYMAPMKVIIPTQYKDDEEANAIQSVANSMANPITNGSTAKIYASYPILQEKYVSISSLLSSNFVTISSVEKVVLNQCNNIPIYFDKQGYEYAGQYYSRKYFILCITVSPYNNEYNMLSITTNDVLFLSRHLYMRKMSLPSYTNGVHPHLNYDLVIVDENQVIKSYL